MSQKSNTQLLHARQLCAICGSGTTQYDVVHLRFEKSGRIRLCEGCFESVIDDGATQQCGMCNRGSEYGTWRLERYDTYSQVDAQSMKHVPDNWLFCEIHFRELANKVDSRPRQTRLYEFC